MESASSAARAAARTSRRSASSRSTSTVERGSCHRAPGRATIPTSHQCPWTYPTQERRFRSARRERYYQHIAQGRSIRGDRADRTDAVPGMPIVAHEQCSRLAQRRGENFPSVGVVNRACPAGGVAAGDQKRRNQGDTVLVTPLGGCVALTVG